jgi:hypothetical protein
MMMLTLNSVAPFITVAPAHCFLKATTWTYANHVDGAPGINCSIIPLLFDLVVPRKDHITHRGEWQPE